MLSYVMNVMNSNNIDNRLQSKRDTASNKLAIKMGEEKKLLIKLRTAASEGEKQPIEEEHVDVLKATKVSSLGIEGKKTKRKRKSPLVPWKKPEGMPKRPLSAYNLFFQDRRKSIMQAASESNEDLHELKQSQRKSSKKKSGVGFANLARTIGTEWRALEPEKKAPYESLAASDKDRYDREMKVWRAKEKEEKSLRESKAQAFESSVLPSFASITAARKGFGEDLHSLRTTDTSTSYAEMIGGMGGGDRSADMLSAQDRESRGAFHSSIYSNYATNPYSMDPSSDQPSNILAQQHLQDSLYSSAGNLTPFNNAVIKEHLEQNAILRENLQYGIGSMGASSLAQASQLQSHPFLSSGSIANTVPKTMAWSSQRNALNMGNSNAMSTSIDLEPLPLPEDHQQHLQQKISQKVRDLQMGYSGQHGLQQMYMKDQQQQRINIPSDGQFLKRLSTGGTSLFSAGWGQNNLTADINEPIMFPHGDRTANQEHAEKNAMASASANIDRQEIGINLLEHAKRRNNDTRSFPSSSNNADEDPYKPF